MFTNPAIVERFIQHNHLLRMHPTLIGILNFP